MHQSVWSSVESLIDGQVHFPKPVRGGDIASAWRFECEGKAFFAKVMQEPNGYAMLLSEQAGLRELSSAGCTIPRIIGLAPGEAGGVLVMEYVKQSTSRSGSAALGRMLASVHSHTADLHGWYINNYIGRLPQSNTMMHDWADYYQYQRLAPLLRQAVDEELLSIEDLPSSERMGTVLHDLMPEVVPSLLHGDLWGGNYLVSDDGTPYLIDPSVYYGHDEVDIAMSRLFGGFDSAFYDAYHEQQPQQPQWEERQDLYQLYYLLVHLLLFGVSYRSAVLSILRRYCS